MSPELDLVEMPVYRALIEGHHEVRRQVVCKAGRIDIYDDTTDCIIECKAYGDASSITAAMVQLNRYRKCFSWAQIAVAVPRVEPEARWLADLLKKDEVVIIEVERGVGV